MRNMKMLGLIAVAAMALAAFVGTSAASATAFTAGEASEAISENTTKAHTFTITGSEVECGNNAFTGTTTGKEAESQELHPTYTECEAFGFAGATVDTNNCEYVFSSATSGTPGHANLTLKGCDDSTEGIRREVNLTPFAHCIVDIPEQTIATAVRYENPAAGTIRVDFTATKIMVDVTESAGFCPLSEGTHSGANGATYTGQSDLTTAKGVTYDA